MTEISQFIFRISLFVLIHSLFAVPSIKRRLAARSIHLRRLYRLYYNLASLVLLCWVMSAFRHSAVLYVVPGVWSLVLYFMQTVFLIILIICVSQTGAAEFLGFFVVNPGGQEIPRLATGGWYRVVRHPLYLFSILFLLSNPVISVRWLIFTSISVVYFIVGARIEERRLLVEFGSKYQGYQRAVPFMIPRIFTR